MVHWVELNEAQRKRYEHLRLAMDRKVREEIARRGLASSQMVILEALLKLRQVCCDLRLVKGEAGSTRQGEGSAKLDSLLDMLRELVAEGVGCWCSPSSPRCLRLSSKHCNGTPIGTSS